MSVYLIASYNIVNPEVYEKYIYAADQVMEKYNGELLVADDESKNLEGLSSNTSVILRFDSEADAMGFYNDPDYIAIKNLRLESTENNVVTMSNQFVFPE